MKKLWAKEWPFPTGEGERWIRMPDHVDTIVLISKGVSKMFSLTKSK